MTVQARSQDEKSTEAEIAEVNCRGAKHQGGGGGNLLPQWGVLGASPRNVFR